MRARVHGPAHASERGFTLLELLVAMTLLGLLTVMLSGGLRFGGRVWERGEVKADQSAGVREFLRRSVEGMLPEPKDIDDPASGLLVSGSATSLEFTTRTMAEAALGGRYLLRLEQGEDAEGTRFVASWRRLPPGGSPSGDGTEMEVRTLLNGVRGVDFAYMSASGEWTSSWADSPQLPRYVRIRLRYPDGDARRWPELVVAPRISADLSCLYGAELPICKNAVR